jgi:hypothetical protein
MLKLTFITSPVIEACLKLFEMNDNSDFSFGVSFLTVSSKFEKLLQQIPKKQRLAIAVMIIMCSNFFIVRKTIRYKT